MNGGHTVLVVEDDREMRTWLGEELRDAGYHVESAAGGADALTCLRDGHVDLVVTDLVMPGMQGHELLAEIRALDTAIPVVIVTAFGSIESAVDAMRAGAFHYVAKPFSIEDLLATVDRALVRHRGWDELAAAGDVARAGAMGLVAESAVMRRAIALAMKAAAADVPVLLLGESGTGKELLARAIHGGSPRHDAPFLAINCAAIPEPLLETQLFGHRRGAFTGAHEDRRGVFQAAEGGTLLLDEIGDMPPALQAKLLRVIQEREIHPVGEPRPIAVDVRIVAATHRDLDRAVATASFRQDLYYRLNVISVRVPPLRERREDVEPLVHHFLATRGARLGRPGVHISAAALAALRHHDWPGNVRELENAIERALVIGAGDEIGVADLPASIRRAVTQATAAEPVSLAGMEREHILRTLEAVGGNRAAAARLLAVDRKTLWRRLKQYGIA